MSGDEIGSRWTLVIAAVFYTIYYFLSDIWNPYKDPAPTILWVILWGGAILQIIYVKYKDSKTKVDDLEKELSKLKKEVSNNKNED